MLFILEIVCALIFGVLIPRLCPSRTSFDQLESALCDTVQFMKKHPQARELMPMKKHT